MTADLAVYLHGREEIAHMRLVKWGELWLVLNLGLRCSRCWVGTIYSLFWGRKSAPCMCTVSDALTLWFSFKKKSWRIWGEGKGAEMLWILQSLLLFLDLAGIIRKIWRIPLRWWQFSDLLVKNIALVGYERGASGTLLIPIQESEISWLHTLPFI